MELFCMAADLRELFLSSSTETDRTFFYLFMANTGRNFLISIYFANMHT